MCYFYSLNSRNIFNTWADQDRDLSTINTDKYAKQWDCAQLFQTQKGKNEFIALSNVPFNIKSTQNLINHWINITPALAVPLQCFLHIYITQHIFCFEKTLPPPVIFLTDFVIRKPIPTGFSHLRPGSPNLKS